MKVLDWLMLGGVAWFLKKRMNKMASEREQQEKEHRRREEEYIKMQEEKSREEEALRKEENLRKKEDSRKDAVNDKRKNTPCLFADGISSEEFCDMATQIGKRLKRIKQVSVKGATVSCIVESQSGYSHWNFCVDFNDWGHITGVWRIWSENNDSNIPNHFGYMMASAIHQLLLKRNISLKTYSNIVDKNLTLETKAGLEFHKKAGLLEKLFSREKSIISQYDSIALVGEHLYPVVSFLKSNGFCNIKSIPAKDIGRDGKNFQFEVEQIVINGSSFFEEGDIFSENSEVIIIYHEKQEIVMPFSGCHFINRDYIDVENELWSLGFSEICEYAIRDLITGWLRRDGSVEKVTIAGKEVQRNAVYKYDDKLAIYYHTYL